MSIDISVIICTFNRCSMLADTLQSWLEVARKDIASELIVVDNASTDATPDVVDSFQKRDAEILYVRESRRGLSFARNRGIAEARGSIIAFVDDDVFFDRQWLTKMWSAFRNRPEIDCIGGRSIPKFEALEPDWLTERILKYYGSTQSGDAVRLMIFPEHPFGVNMAFRKKVFRLLEGFRTDLGRRGNSLLSDEEKELFYRVFKAEMKVLYTPDAIIHHRVPPERVNPRWLMRRAYWQGISSVIFDKHVREQSRLRLLKNLYRSLRSLALSAEGFRHRTSHRPTAIQAQINRRIVVGVLRQSAVELLRPPSLRRNVGGRP